MQTPLQKLPQKPTPKILKHDRIPTFVKYYNAGGEIKEDDLR